MEKKKNASTVILAIVVSLLLIIGAIASLFTLSTTFYSAFSSTTYDRHYDDHYYDNDGQYDHGGERSYNGSEWNGTPYFSNTYSLEQLESYFGMQLTDEHSGNGFEEGMYIVGETRGFGSGLYYFEGKQDRLCEFSIFEQTSYATDYPAYQIRASIEYIGNYYADLKDGDLVIFLPGDDSLEMHKASSRSDNLKSNIDSGCYRVGIDIPAGTYKLDLEIESIGAVEMASGDPAAYVMEDVDFVTNSIVEEVDVKDRMSSKTVTVEEGQYLELFGVRASKI